MAINKVQFQPRLSMTEFMERYGRDGTCETALIESRTYRATGRQRSALCGDTFDLAAQGDLLV